METQNNAEQISLEKTDTMKETKKAAGLLFTGSMFIGMAAGWYFGNLSILVAL